jgi:ABC-type uncharacterized transport system auxiliary subunit
MVALLTAHLRAKIFFAKTMAAAAVAIGLSACATPVSIPKETFYTFTQPYGATPTSPPLAATVLVHPFRSSGILKERAVLYTTTDANDSSKGLQQYDYHYWAEAPGRFLQHEFIRALQEKAFATFILDRPTGGMPDYDIEGQITHLYHDRTAGKVHIGLIFTLTDTRRATLLLHQSYQVTRPISAPTQAASAMAGFEAALHQLFPRVIADAQASIAAAAPQEPASE